MNTRQRITAVLVVLAAFAVAASLAAAAKTTASKKREQAAAAAASARVKRGEYLVTIGHCHDCHTPWKMGPKGPEPDMSRALSGHPQNLALPAPPKGSTAWSWSGADTNTAFSGPWGISYTANLTPDRLTGIGIWDEAMFMKTIRTGRHWGVSRPILPPMPWQNVARMTDEDLKSVYAYLRSIKPVRNQVPEPVIAQ
jgi:mono/diheme cytochrome c family protein